MKIVIWGARGSIPSPGANTIRYGGNTTCLEIRPAAGPGVIIVDAGSGLRLLGKKLLAEAGLEQLTLLLTHSHWDHLQGFPFFTPAYFSRFAIDVSGGPQTQGMLHSALQTQMTPPCFPVDFSVMKARFSFAGNGNIVHEVGSITIEPIPLSHPGGGYGFKFSEGGKSFVFLTDNEPALPHPGGRTLEDYVTFCHAADLLIHDAQYTDEEYRLTRGWGHSTYADAVQLALSARVRRFGLFHHDPDRSDADLDERQQECRQLIAQSGADLDCFAVAEGMEFEL